MSDRWSEFQKSKPDYLDVLADAVCVGATRTDSSHPAFHGWYDWHSAVHGTLALLLLHRMTGQEKFLQLAEPILRPELIQGELGEVVTGRIPQELPYGYAWFLALAQEHHRATGSLLLADIANFLAGELAAHALDSTDEELQAGLTAHQYRNMSWALLNVLAWSRYTENAALETTLTEMIAERVFAQEQAVLASCSGKLDDFFDPANLYVQLRCAVDTEVSPADAVRILPLSRCQPIVEFPTVHSAGLNFSRCWGFWRLFEKTGEIAYRDAFVESFQFHIAVLPEQCTDYNKYGHWVGQFGVYALALAHGAVSDSIVV